MPPEPDYPAAHSMDAEWFAVDKDGHVGVFHTGEAGALPDEAASTYTDEDLFDRIVASAPPSQPLFDLAGWIAKGGGQAEPHVSLDETYVSWSLMFLESLEPVRDAAERGDVVAFPAPLGVAVFNRDLPKDELIRLHQAGLCLGCFDRFDDGFAGPLGLFSFDHSDACENWIAGPYVRKEVPSEPLKVDQLPSDLRDAIASVRFGDLSFGQVERLQPVEHVPCGTWDGDAYVAADGVTIRALPGHEAEFRNAYAAKWTDPKQRDAEKPYRYEPPPA